MKSGHLTVPSLSLHSRKKNVIQFFPASEVVQSLGGETVLGSLVQLLNVSLGRLVTSLLKRGSGLPSVVVVLTLLQDTGTLLLTGATGCLNKETYHEK